MSALSLLVLLTALPCAEREATAHSLEELARTQPSQLPAALEGLTPRLRGVPLPPAEEGATAPQRAKQVADFLEHLCALEARRDEVPVPELSTEEQGRLKAILDRPEFAQARKRHGDLLKQWMRRIEGWLEGLFESREAQGFAVATRAVMLGLALAVVLWGVLRLRERRLRRPVATTGATLAERPLVLDAPPEHLRRARAALPHDAREGIREGLLALLSSLEERRWARPDRVRTNRELAAELPSRGAPAAVVGEVERLVRWYDQTFYSLTPVREDEATRFIDAVERLHREPGAEVAA
ncbi:DUF4129 domain-containing protein [Myxococcus sp. K15C18031901]|uniref:DUF4129 domain-containing protein n=1 Tax=Myxococcus dinghuensis TaxID=2906761 RepID=UPI0020A7DF97|nr:DUF4129 domain-containing protein [Myxococcus dinghuensis]MCP3103411.1 DUF4129 domain-containing protein [Myxococcus dinghuensis]